MNASEFESIAQDESKSAVNLYCMGTLVADEASRKGFKILAKSIETALAGLLLDLTHDQQRHALRLSYELAVGDEQPAGPRLRLVYSRA